MFTAQLIKYNLKKGKVNMLACCSFFGVFYYSISIDEIIICQLKYIYIIGKIIYILFTHRQKYTYKQSLYIYPRSA